VLVIVLVETGRAEEALAALGESLKRTLTASERKSLIGIEALLNRSRPRSQWIAAIDSQDEPMATSHNLANRPARVLALQD
jgi:hypothetical protein